ncbi:hypothetical protein GCM10010123_06040 [Pilimelia anulata]|uniref:CheW-like domain-containing protein n=1 Tax=Pilimelia anulata TaxID=53371 RepID=A0A8J3B6V0_9ACTN|nr:chemotaxis protein CheW [Pilimelia anulata]GGJ78915.1 hypothetical protein GCM10010123_06040 [Pilimelia anulata]
MSPAAGDLADRLGPLRSAFDRSFMDPPRPSGEAGDHLLAVGVGARRCAIRLAETAGLFADRPVTALPGPLPGLLGVATFRGVVVPVYGLASVLGDPPDPDPRWLVLAAGTPALALAFGRLDGHLRLPADALVRYPPDADRPRCLNGMARLPDRTLGVLDLRAIRAEIHALAGHPEGS